MFIEAPAACVALAMNVAARRQFQRCVKRGGIAGPPQSSDGAVVGQPSKRRDIGHHRRHAAGKRFEHRVRFVFRHFPLTDVHAHAELAAESAEAAGAQHKFWPMYALLFEHQHELKLKDLRRYAAQLELDLERFDYELGDQVYRQRVNEHIDGARRSGVRQTPTFFVNGVITDVSFGLEHLYQAVEKALAG